MHIFFLLKNLLPEYLLDKSAEILCCSEATLASDSCGVAFAAERPLMNFKHDLSVFHHSVIMLWKV